MQPIASYLLHRHSPLCPPSWRWGWAQAFVDFGRPRPRNLDEAALSALRLSSALHGRIGPNDAHHLATSLAALAVYQGPRQQRDMLDAWLLSGETDAPIGHRLGIEPAVVGDYEQIFYAVRDRRRAADWIILCAIGWPIDPDGHRDIASVLKLLAYLGGPLVLDVVLLSMGMSTALGAGRPLCVVDEALSARIRLLVDLLCNPPRGRMAIRLWNQIREIEARRPHASAGGSSGSDPDLQVGDALDQIDWNSVTVPDAAACEEPEIVEKPASTVA